MIETESLWSQVVQCSYHAIQAGALKSWPTECHTVADHGIQFQVRILKNLQFKHDAKQNQKKHHNSSFNPFLPFEKDLYVADLSENHVAILNKFNVVDYHLLIITRHFEPQESLLSMRDFDAALFALSQYNNLVFYNSGEIAGASQRHKHLQVIPVDHKVLPISAMMTDQTDSHAIKTVVAFPFRHCIVRFEQPLQYNAHSVAQLESIYNEMLSKMQRSVKLEHEYMSVIQPYNLLLTQHWMMLVPRSQECYQSISVNALGFAGSLLVKSNAQFDQLKSVGPMAYLKNTGIPS